MIAKLTHQNRDEAQRIYHVFQQSYKIEAQLIGTEHFPPLSRTTADISNSPSDFYGFFEQDTLAAVIEIEVAEQTLDIHSLTVDPQFFRKGIADKLMRYVLSEFATTQAIVETAAVNEPAIRLYRKHGFVITKRFTPSHGIEKVAMRLT
ncbi:GNAT family N-acetyltransferase [Pseudoalteromonas sp. JBTF-M23]|uniref:GNAT family N-acetyltransferase n=1 Tax=Pseudoalteromonas caenipelagi TaxID=2726988 RepID=A0A849VFJ4_9GAMM|nr:N-acetyltransferase [Pseudoalteromonas caenipelagi]NOU50481.1 GNAT family N-acetyltransferase [Pseudoalteromonas caenipelagi]